MAGSSAMVPLGDGAVPVVGGSSEHRAVGDPGILRSRALSLVCRSATAFRAVGDGGSGRRGRVHVGCGIACLHRAGHRAHHSVSVNEDAETLSTAEDAGDAEDVPWHQPLLKTGGCKRSPSPPGGSGDRTSANASGERCARTTRRAEMPGITSRTIMRAAAPIAGAKTDSPAFAT